MLYGAKNHPPTVAPNVWGWVDPLGLFGDGGPNSKYKGHSDFTGGDYFNYTLEDRGPTGPFRDPKRHFRPLEISERDVIDAIEKGDKEAFQGAMHRGQDFFSHYSKGYRWKPFRALKSLGFGHIFAGTKPDEDIVAWKKAEEWTKKWVGKWFEKNQKGGSKRLKC